MNHNDDFVAPRAERLLLRPWRVSDAQAALRIYEHPDTAQGPSPSIARVSDLTAMRVLLEEWLSDDCTAPAGRWAVERRHDHQVIGGASLLPLPPGNHDLEIAWRLDPVVAQRDHATDIVSTLAPWAFDHYVDEIFAVVRPDDTRTAANVAGSGMRWVGETTKYFGLDLQIYRLRPEDLFGVAPLQRAS